MFRLKMIRQAKRMSADSVSELLEISKSTYRNWEQGKYQPNIEQLIKLSDIFCVSIDYLVGNDKKFPM